MHQNVQSIGNSINKLNVMLISHPECQVMCVSEHWKSEDQLKSFSINGLKLGASFCREEGRHGGTAVFVRNDVKSSARVKLNKLSISNVFECSAIECQLCNVNIVVVCIYRPPQADLGMFFL